MEGAVIVCRQLIQFLQHRKLLRFKCVPTGTEKIQSHTVAEEDSLLAFVNYELRPVVKILDWMLPDESRIIALILDNGGETIMLDLFLRSSLGNVVYMITHRASEFICTFCRTKPNATLTARELNRLILLRHCIDRFMADRALGFIPLGLIEHHVITAVRALSA